MKRTLALLLLLAFGTPAWGQDVLIMRTPSDCFDLARDDLGAGKLGSNADTNTAAIQLAQDRQGFALDSSTRVKKPIYVPPGIWPIKPLILGVNEAHTAARQGLQILTGGGTGTGLNSNSLFVGMGNITRLLYTGLKNNNQAAITYHGAGLWLGPMELCGITLTTGDHYNNRDNNEQFPKTPTGFRITSLGTSGVPNGRIQSAGLLLQGFEKGIEVYQADTGGNNDNLTWNFLDFDACDVGYECNSSQSVTHLVHKVHTHFYVDTLFKFVKGGDLQCESAQINCPNCTILDLSGMTYEYDNGNYSLSDVRLDNIADNPVLCKLSAYAGKPRPVSITGKIGNSLSYTTADLVQGENAADKIFINFTGPAQAVADFNDLSTVDASGNYRTRSYTVQVTPLGSNLTTGDGKAYFRVPAELDGWRLEYVAASLDAPSSSGAPTFQVRRKRSGADVDMFSTKITIDQGETDTASAAIAQVINTSNDDVEEGDRLYFDCDVAGTNAQGYQAYLTFRRW